MKSPIIVGPLLGFEAGEYYTVCALLEPDQATPVLELPQQNQTHPFAKAAIVGRNDFWRTEFKIPIPATGQHVAYRIKLNDTPVSDQHGRAEWRFYLPGKDEEPAIAYASCNGFSSLKLARDTDEPYELWRRMADRHEKKHFQGKPLSLLLMGGDQVYADDMWESAHYPELQRWNKLSWSKQNKVTPGLRMRREFERFYNWLYTDRWEDEHMSLMLASVPSIMMWDDHDIFDGWGSYPKERHQCDVFQEAFKHASRVFDIFQLRCSTRSRLNAAAHHRALVVRFRNYDILVLDNRTERTLTEIMSEQHWGDVKQWLANRGANAARELLVMAGVPVLYRRFARAEKLFDTTPWHEAVEDDIHDHWADTKHQAERMRLIMVLMNYLQEQKKTVKRGILLSGDVHVGALGQIWRQRDSIGLTQVVSSGIVHPPPTALQWVGIKWMSTDHEEELGDGEIVTNMIAPFGSDRYLRTRNFSTLHTGTDGKVWINWVCEDEKLNPCFAIG